MVVKSVNSFRPPNSGTVRSFPLEQEKRLASAGSGISKSKSHGLSRAEHQKQKPRARYRGQSFPSSRLGVEAR